MSVPSPRFSAYKGSEPYVFVSYARVDSAEVYDVMDRWRAAQRVNLWFDEGIDPGNEWPEDIAVALDGCAAFVVFISPAAARSVNVRNEINFALAKGVPFAAVYLEDTELSLGMKLQIGSKQAINKYRMDERGFEAQSAKFFAKAKVAAAEVAVKTVSTGLVPVSPGLREELTALELPERVTASLMLSPLVVDEEKADADVLSVYRTEDGRHAVLAGRYGQGRFVVLSHDGLLHDGPENVQPHSMTAVLTSLLGWLGRDFRRGVVGWSTGHGEMATSGRLASELRHSLASRQVSSRDVAVADAATVDVLVVANPRRALRPDEVDEMLSWVRSGGSVVFSGLGWSWSQIDPSGQGDLDRYPLNEIGRRLGFRFEPQVLGQRITVEDKTLYFTALQRSREVGGLTPVGSSADGRAAEQDDANGQWREYVADIEPALRAAERGDANAQWRVGIALETKGDEDAAFYWFHKSSFAGNGTGQHRLGRMYINGSGAPRNDAMAVAWYGEAARQGVIWSQGQLGEAYLRGLYGLDIDVERGLELTRASAEGGWTAAQYRLGQAYESGIHVDIDLAQAAAWYLRAASADTGYDFSSDAQLRLGVMLRDGVGVPANPDKARFWLEKALARGLRQASTELELLEMGLSAG
ncbi:MAG: toll/interleukin-1 receptor domain-containing protein [Aeromicrobium sp.]|uniref:TIR domain-containing protein n=1 Tax=Aeromicrobium sp. TaxID=1871063 RepID=UPI0039E57570